MRSSRSTRKGLQHLPTNTAFEEVERVFRDRPAHARELSRQGKDIIGYFCCYVPGELFTALDLVPYRVHGDIDEQVTDADAYLETIMCPYVRSCFDLALKGKYEFLSGLVVPHSCDTVQRIYDIWRSYLEPKYHHFLNVPHMVDESSVDFFRQEIATFAQSLERFTGRRIEAERLQGAIRLHNRNRALLRELYSLRKSDPPLITGVEVARTIIANMSIPVLEANDLLVRLLGEVGQRSATGTKGQPRILISGSEFDDSAFVELVESCGANVVADDLCIGSRFFWEDVDVSLDPWESLAVRYLRGIRCPRTYLPKGASRETDLETRFGYIKSFVQDYKVNGVILNVMRFCDTHELDAPDIRDYVQGMGISTLYLENDYSRSSSGQLRTRIEAFLEMIG